MSEGRRDGKPTITCARNGPLIVKRLQHLCDAEGRALETGANVALCRCGGSANKPYCDGTHARNGFADTNTADRSHDRVDRYAGREITILDNRFICAHVGECTAGLPEVFRYGEEPWIDPDGASAERIEAVVRRCPSGALAYARGGTEVHDRSGEPSITVSKDGPYHVAGGVHLETDAWAQGVSRDHYALCRCGASANKPFCDGSHYDIDFRD